MHCKKEPTVNPSPRPGCKPGLSLCSYPHQLSLEAWLTALQFCQQEAGNCSSESMHQVASMFLTMVSRLFKGSSTTHAEFVTSAIERREFDVISRTRGHAAVIRELWNMERHGSRCPLANSMTDAFVTFPSLKFVCKSY
jgi:hypothetical protein